MRTTSALRLAEIGENLLDVLEAAGHVDGLALGRLLVQRLRNPQSYITMVGETSSGKSTLVNALLGTPLLPAYARPTTGTVIQVICREGEVRYLAINRDATQRDLTSQQFARLSELPPQELLRLQLRAPDGTSKSSGLNVFDTPGYNSVLAAHEEVLRQFLPESDVVVVVAGYRSGFGQADQDLLEAVQYATAGNQSLPVLLVINRTPPGTGPTDRRIQEILKNAADSLRRDPELIVVTSSTAGDD